VGVYTVENVAIGRFVCGVVEDWTGSARIKPGAMRPATAVCDVNSALCMRLKSPT